MSLNLTEYIQQAKRTCPSLGSLNTDLQHMYLGLVTEVGELLDIFKKNLAYKKEIDLVHVAEECADIHWYLGNTVIFNEITLDPAMIQQETESIIKELSETDISIEEQPVTIICHFLECVVAGKFEYYESLFALLAVFCTQMNIDYEQMLQNNIDKLQLRYPEGFSTDKALNRNTTAERLTLEKTN